MGEVIPINTFNWITVVEWTILHSQTSHTPPIEQDVIVEACQTFIPIPSIWTNETTRLSQCDVWTCSNWTIPLICSNVHIHIVTLIRRDLWLNETVVFKVSGDCVMDDDDDDSELNGLGRCEQTCSSWLFCDWGYNHHDGMKQDGWIWDHKSGMDDDGEGWLRQTGMMEWCFPCQCVWVSLSWDCKECEG